MKSKSLVLLALVAHGIAGVPLQANRQYSKDMEGQVHSWASDWHHSVPHKTDAFSVSGTDLEGDVATQTSTPASSSTSTVGSGVLSKRAVLPTTSSSTTKSTTKSTSKSSSTTTRHTTTTTTHHTTTTTTKTTAKTTTTSGHSQTVDAELQTTTSKTTTRPSTTTTRTTTTTKPTTTTTSSRTTTTTAKTTTTTTTTTKTTTTSKTSTAPAATRTINVTGMTYQNALMVAHNVHRSNHSLPDLVWNQDLADTAAEIAANCVYGHNVTADGGGYGQNIGAGASGNAAAGLITNLMYNGEINYYPQPYGNDDVDLTNFHLWGHYSQIVWDDTTDVGCYTQYCPSGLANTGPGVAPYFTVCNYSPPGNYVGEFSSVAAPNGGQSVVIIGT